MDPASIVGVVAVAAEILKTIHHYTQGAVEYGDEVASLRVELFCLKSALTQIDGHVLASPANEFFKMLDEARSLLQALADSLQVEASPARELARRLIWPLKKQHVKDLTTRLERIKTYFILVATNDTRDAARVAASTLEMLYKSIEELKTTDQDKSQESASSRWLTSFDPHIHHAAASSARYENTNAWFLENYLTGWALSGLHPFLWLRCKPGSGKTCIAAACISRLQQVPGKRHVVYFYCSNNNAESQQPRTVLAWLVKRLYQQAPEVRNLVHQAYAEDVKAQGGVPDATASLFLITQLATSICRCVDRDVILVIDAIDETGENSRTFLKTVFDVVSRCSQLRLVLTSTESVVGQISSISRDLLLEYIDVEINAKDVKRDIDMYIEKRLDEESVLSKLRPQLKTDIRKTLQQEHNGSFRWAQCTIDDLASLTTPRAIKEAVKGITPSLSNIYMSVLRTIPTSIAGVAGSTLLYLFAALRQLTLAELAEAAVFISHTDFDEDDRIIEPEAIIRHLRSLVRYEPVTQKVELAHSSVRVFLATPEKSGDFHIDAASANQAMCHLCLGYLLLPSFSKACADTSELRMRKQNWPLLEYTTYWWAHHVRAAAHCLSDDNRALAAAFFDSAKREDGGSFAAWYQCAYPRRGSRTWTTKPLYICAREGLVDILKILLVNIEKDELEEKGGSRGSTALHVAAAFGETEAVKLLIAAGADVNETNRDGEHGLQWAWFWGHNDTVEVLIQAGADPSLLNTMDMGAMASVRAIKNIRNSDVEGLVDVGQSGAEVDSSPLSIGSRAHTTRKPGPLVAGRSVQSWTTGSVSSSNSINVPGRSARLHEIPLRERRQFLGGTSLSQEERLREEVESRDFKIPPRAIMSPTSASGGFDFADTFAHSMPRNVAPWPTTLSMSSDPQEVDEH
ncbi:ankyrin repeats (3 copies) domain-containing protein [Sarocladium implicatum]|nr:ankyrin repeats (3 copies) domain-containing protein [Sarocladium implicatum]